MNKPLLLIAFVCLLCFSCSPTGNCPDGINKLPMYGRVKKCAGQIQTDSTFLKSTTIDFKSRKEAAKYFVKRAWGYYYQNKPDTAMMRFNQAWMLDSLNAGVYWGFANLVGQQGKYKESLPLFTRSIELDSLNANVWESASVSYGQLFVSTRQVDYLNTAIKYLKRSIALKPGPKAYAALTAAYTYFLQKDSASKYLKITDSLDKSAVNPEVRKLINNK